MRCRSVLALACALAACSSRAPAPKPSAIGGPVPFRALQESRNQHPCADRPDTAVAIDEDAWIDVFDRQTSCLASPEIKLPRVRFGDEIGVAIWWRAADCEALGVHTSSVERTGAELVIKASTTKAGTCAKPLGALESFLAVSRSDLFNGTQKIVLELDGEPLPS